MPRKSAGQLIRRHCLTRWRNWLAGAMLTGLAIPAFAQAGSPPESSNSVGFTAELFDANLPDTPESQVAGHHIATGSIQGVVSNQDGAVYEGVHITLGRPGADPAIPAPERTAVTDSNGHFLFADVPAGPFLLTVTSEGFATQRVAGVLKPDETYQAPAIVLPVSTATSEIRVTASRNEIAEEELHLEEEQRVLGFIPNFYVVYDANAPALTPRQKFHLAWKSSLDPVNFLVTGATAGVQQADDTFSGYGQGASGYAKRYGANFADGFIGDMLSGAVLPALFKQDPRYFYKGRGSIRSRALYAIATAVICKGDNGHWQFDYSGILGSLAAGGISNLYYPAKDRNGIGLTFEGAAYGIAGNAVGNLFQEFLVRKLMLKGSKRTSPQP
jgi:hypothetical protein